MEAAALECTRRSMSKQTDTPWFQTFAVFWMLYAFFWVIPRHLNFRRRGITQKKAYNSQTLSYFCSSWKCSLMHESGVDSSWNVMAHGDAREGKWRGNWRMECVPFTLPRNVVYPALLSLMLTTRLPVVDWTDAPADLNGLVCFVERRNLVSARVRSHFNWPLIQFYPESSTGGVEPRAK